MDEIRVLLIAPSLDILGGQAVQATRLLAQLNGFQKIRMKFQPMNPRVGWFEPVRWVRTIGRMLIYLPSLLLRVPSCDILHIFSAGLTSFTLWTIPAVLIGRMFGKKVIINYRDGQAEEHVEKFRSA